MTEDKERVYLIDNLKVLLILLVVFGHVIEYYINTSSLLMGIYMFIYMFHMPLFVFISGYLSKNVERCRHGIVKSLLIPYVVLNIIWYIIASVWTGKIIFSLFNPGWTLWYLISLFFWRFFIKYLCKIKYRIPISIMLALLISIIPNGKSLGFVLRTITFLPYFLIGYSTKGDRLKSIKLRSQGISFVIIGLFIAISNMLAHKNFITYKFFYNSQSYIETGLTTSQGIVYRIILYVVSIILGVCVINVTPKSKLFFTKMGKATMNIYIFHIYIVLILYAIIPKWNIDFKRNTCLIASPFLITYLLSSKKLGGLYNDISKVLDTKFYPKILIVIKKYQH
ncbi:MAG: acyltransferase family protein [Clostridium sp.]